MVEGMQKHNIGIKVDKNSHQNWFTLILQKVMLIEKF